LIVGKNHAYFSLEDYLEVERVSPIKHEYLQGQIVAMAGASKAHAIITGNLSAQIVTHLRGSNCISYAVDMKVRLPTLNLFYYPDLAVTCDKGDLNSDEAFSLHPKLIIASIKTTRQAS
jgi:Uma2 family endonuclease